MNKRQRQARRRRATSEFRDRYNDALAEVMDGDFVHVAFPHLDDDTSQSGSMSREQAAMLVERGLVYVVGGRYFSDDAAVVRAALAEHREIMHCDFCSSTEPAWSYPARDAVALEVVLPDGTVGHESYGAWAACGACAELVDADDRGGLLERASKLIGPTLDVPPEFARMALAATQDTFWQARTGGREPL